jgi:hypothetical protein
MNKKILLLTCFCMAWLFSNGEPITRQQALKNAVAFQEEMQGHKRLVAVSDEKKLAPRKGKTTQDTDAYYVFNRENDEGFIIVSGDDKTIPVLGYCDKDVTADEDGNATIYDLQGRKVQDSKDSTPTTLQKGIYIINGKKVVRNEL